MIRSGSVCFFKILQGFCKTIFELLEYQACLMTIPCQEAVETKGKHSSRWKKIHSMEPVLIFFSAVRSTSIQYSAAPSGPPLLCMFFAVY